MLSGNFLKDVVIYRIKLRLLSTADREIFSVSEKRVPSVAMLRIYYLKALSIAPPRYCLPDTTQL